MVWSIPKRNIVEIFRIQAEDFDLWAGLISLEDERFIINGRTRFAKGDVSGFYSEVSDRLSLRKRLLCVCQPIAAFYGTEVVHRVIEAPAKQTEALFVVSHQSQMLH